MSSNNSNRSRAAWARGFVALCAVLVTGLGLMVRPAAAAPFAYVANVFDSTVSVIDTATNTRVATVPVVGFPFGVAVTPDGKHAYVVNFVGTVSVIDTATNTVEETLAPVGPFAEFLFGVAVTPDGKHVYVANSGSNTVSVIDTATNTVEAATITVGSSPFGIAVTPDGAHAYVANDSLFGTVSVIDTASNTAVGTPIPVGLNPSGIAVTPDGLHAYVANTTDDTVSVIDTATNTVMTTVVSGGNGSPAGVAVTPDGKQVYVVNATDSVSVIDTATNTVVTTITVVGAPTGGIAITPDGKHAYVTNSVGNVSVIDTATNTVVATIPVGNEAVGLGIIPDVPFLAFNAALEIHFGRKPNTDAFALESSFTLSSTAPAINPVTQPVTLQAGTFATTLPPGSFKQAGPLYTYVGVINGVNVQALITPTGTLRYGFVAAAERASLTGTKNQVTARVSIGVDSGTKSV